jgi:type VI secretion system protein ImpE
MLELILNGRYCWAPFHRIHSLQFEAPTDLRDTVWMPAQVQWSNGGEAVALVPARYPGSEASEDSAIRMARKTQWTSRDGGLEIGLGQRLLATDDADYAILEVRSIKIGEAPAVTGDRPAAATGTEARDG